MFAIAIWDGIREGLGSVLAFFYSVVPNSGVAIIMLTVAVRLALFPLTAKQAKSMIAMQRVQPEIKKLQAKYKNDRQKLNEEMMKFYKENEINPLGGCLPLVLQMPIFIALFQTLRGIQKFIPKDSKLPAYVVCNADESEPGTFKDREILEENPFQLLEGIVLAAYAVGCHRSYIYIRGEYEHQARVLDSAIAISPVTGLMVGTTLQPRPAARTEPRCTSAADTANWRGS